MKKRNAKLLGYIPWDRVDDFIKCEKLGRADVKTTVVRDKNDPTKVGDKCQYGWNSHIEYRR